jgi:hypothetical protein
MSLATVSARMSVLVAGVAILAWSAGAAAAPGNASGQMTVGGKTTPLAYAYARAEPGFFDKTKEDIHIFLSDVEIPDAALGDQFARQELAAAGKLHAVEVVLSATKEAVSGGLLHEAFARTSGYVSVTGMHQFEATVFDGKTVDGRLFTRKPDSFMDVSFEYTATFHATVWRRPAPTSTGSR